MNRSTALLSVPLLALLVSSCLGTPTQPPPPESTFATVTLTFET